MKKIRIAYWHTKLSDIKYRHLEEFEFTQRKFNSILKYLMANKCWVMVAPLNDRDGSITIYIDNKKFGQY